MSQRQWGEHYRWFTEKHDIPRDWAMVRLYFDFRTGKLSSVEIPYYIKHGALRKEGAPARYIMPGFTAPRLDCGINHFMLQGDTRRPQSASMYVLPDADFHKHHSFFVKQCLRRQGILYRELQARAQKLAVISSDLADRLEQAQSRPGYRV